MAANARRRVKVYIDRGRFARAAVKTPIDMRPAAAVRAAMPQDGGTSRREP